MPPPIEDCLPHDVAAIGGLGDLRINASWGRQGLRQLCRLAMPTDRDKERQPPTTAYYHWRNRPSPEVMPPCTPLRQRQRPSHK